MPSSIPVESADVAAVSTAAARGGSIRRALGRWAAFVANHAIWSIGLRLQRNLSLRMKAVVAAALVGLPLCGFVANSAQNEWAGLRQSQSRLTSLAAMRDLSALARSITGVQRAAVNSQLRLPSPELDADFKADQLRFDGFIQRLDLADWPASTAAAVKSLRESRQTVLKHAADASTAALPGRLGPRLEALAAYAYELTVLRTEMARSSGVTADAPSAVQAMNQVLARTLPKLRWQLARSLVVGLPLYVLSDFQPRARRLGHSTAQASAMLALLESDAVHAMDQGWLDPAVVRNALLLADAHIQRAEALADAAAHSKLPVDPAMTGEQERDAFEKSGLAALKAVETLEDALFERYAAWAVEQASLQRRHFAAYFGLLAVWLLLATYLLICSYQALAFGLQTLVTRLEALGRGDLAQRPQGQGRDEIGRALNALATSTGNMAQLFGAVTQGVAAVSHASREVAGGNGGLTNRSSEVQSLIGNVADRAQACSAALDICGDQVEQTAELVRDMRVDGQRSRKAMGGLREGMARLQGKSREIGQVVSLVEAVAYQTKLLSINASVEAARAGEAGRGFAVVAQEVRGLAVRSERAAQRIASIVSASIEEIEHCGLMAGRTDETVQRNEQKMGEVDTLMREAVNLTRVGRNDSQEVMTIARNVQESMSGNVRVVEQLASASASLRTQGDHLKRSLQHFNFG
jgi:methyl-accepting chemotaxis protein